MPELATKTNQLLEEINQLRLISKVDSFTFTRLEKEAQKLVKIDAFHAYQFLGILASFKEDITCVHENYKKALNFALENRDKSIVLNNYAVSLANMGYFIKAAELSIKSYEYSPPSEVIKLISSRFAYAGLFHYAANFAREYNLVSNDFIFAIAVEAFMDEHGVIDEELQKLIEVGISILHKHKFFNFRNAVHIEFSAGEDSKWLRYVIKIDRSIDEIVEMDYELACALAEVDFSTELLLHFIIVYEIAGE